MSHLPVRFDANGLIPAVIQDADSSDVLMVAYMNSEALRLTRETGKTHFWSRSRAQLWQKGETSGHVQFIVSIAVNCYENCLLVRVRQVGACCHTGYSTCFYREIDPNGELVTTQERVVNRTDVYGAADTFEEWIARWIGAYRWLADHDLESVSGTSRLLRRSSLEELRSRVGDELRELAGVVRGDHVHTNRAEDTMLEGTQVLYWTVLSGIRSGLADDVLTAAVADAQGPVPLGDTDQDLVAGIAREASHWDNIDDMDIPKRIAEAARLVSVAAQVVDLDLSTAIEHDLSDLQTRAYLLPYFESSRQGDTQNS